MITIPGTVEGTTVVTFFATDSAGTVESIVTNDSGQYGQHRHANDSQFRSIKPLPRRTAWDQILHRVDGRRPTLSTIARRVTSADLGLPTPLSRALRSRPMFPPARKQQRQHSNCDDFRHRRKFHNARSLRTISGGQESTDDQHAEFVGHESSVRPVSDGHLHLCGRRLGRRVMRTHTAICPDSSSCLGHDYQPG